MMLMHCTAWSSTFGAHPYHPQHLPNLNLMVSIVAQLHAFGYLYVVHQ